MDCPMALPQAVFDFIEHRAQIESAPIPKEADDLFRSGILDSFSLTELIALIEEQCGITVPDSDVVPDNFRTLETVDRFVKTRQG